MRRVIDPLRAMGAGFSAGADTLPLTVYPSPLHGIAWSSDVASAQVKSAVLLAGLSASSPTIFTEPTLSRDHTERMLTRMGAHLTVDGTTTTLSPGALTPLDLTVPGDISSAAFWFVAACVLGRPLVVNTGINPTRTGCLGALFRMGASVYLQADGGWEEAGDVCVTPGPLRGVRIDGAWIPRLIDEIPVLAIAAAFCNGETVFADAKELRVKESDRIAKVVEGLTAMGVEAHANPDGMRIVGRGGEGVHAAAIESAGDHRIAMAFAIAGLACGMEIHDVDCVDTSYPGFLATLQRLSPGSGVLRGPDAP